jgi:mannose-1-phosphate guanylyltransferase
MIADRQQLRPRFQQAADALWIVVLAGGRGRRLDTFLRTTLGETRPKQFCPITGGRSMLRHTWDRARRLVPAQILTVVTAGQEQFLTIEAKRQRIPGRVLVQPVDRGTGAGVLLPLLWIAQREPDATVAVFPADHFVWEESRFLGQVAEAVANSRCWPDRIVVLGIKPDRADSGYGWIEPNIACAGALPGRKLFTVADFWEKSDEALAGQLFRKGCLWNSFVMAGTVDAYVQMVRTHQPEALEILQAVTSRFGTSAERAAIADAYRKLLAFDFTRDILVPGRDTLLVQPTRDLTWSDCGEPARILETLARVRCRPPWLTTLSNLGRESAGRGAPGTIRKVLHVGKPES